MIALLSTNNNLSDKTRVIIFGVFAALYLIVAIAVTIAINCYTYFKRKKKNHNFTLQSCQFFVQLLIIFSVGTYFVGDNFDDARMINSKKRSTVSTVIIVSGLIGIYFSSGIYDEIADKIKKAKEEEKDNPTEQDQLENQKSIKKNAENFEKLYTYIIKIFGQIPILDGFYTTLLETEDACNPKEQTPKQTYFYKALWIVWSAIILLLIIKLIIQGWCAWNEIEPLKWPVDQVKNFLRSHSCCKCCYKGTENGENGDGNKCGLLHLCIIIIAPILAVVCIGLFLVADNRQPLDCSPHMPKDTNTNYWTRIVFLIISLILCYIPCMITAIILWVCSYCWTNSKESAYEAPQALHELAQTKIETDESSSLLHATDASKSQVTMI